MTSTRPAPNAPRIAAGTETLDAELSRVDALPDGQVVHTRHAERLERRHTADGGTEEFRPQDGPPTARSLPPLGLPDEVHSVVRPPEGTWPPDDFAGLTRSYAEPVRSLVADRLGGRLADIRIQAQAKRRSTSYANDRGSRAVQHWDWSVLGVQLLLRDPAGRRRWTLLVHEDFPHQAPDAVAARVALAAAELAEQPAGPAATGRYELVLAADAAGVFWHEAVGHALEADFDPASRLQVGERATPAGWQVTDEPTEPDGGGHFLVDDEGVGARHTPLVADGRVVGLLTDRAGAAALGVAGTGNGRYGTGQIRPRMANLVVRGPAPDDPVGHGPRLVLSRPIAGRYDGREFVLQCWSSHLEDPQTGDRRPSGPAALRGTPREFLAALRGGVSGPVWLRDGGLCNKGGSDGLHVGLNTPALLFGTAEATGTGDVRMAPL
jgi:hypothetical protein